MALLALQNTSLKNAVQLKNTAQSWKQTSAVSDWSLKVKLFPFP